MWVRKKRVNRRQKFEKLESQILLLYTNIIHITHIKMYDANIIKIYDIIDDKES